MAEVLAAVPIHGVEAVDISVQIALESERPTGELVLNVLARLRETGSAPVVHADIFPKLKVEPRADVTRYDDLRVQER